MKKILLIEDNTEMRENIAEILELSRYEVLTAANGKEGVRLAQTELPDLIICDIMMPELDGYGVLHMLDKDITTASIPFIFLTAKAEKSDQRKGMGLGADDYLTKPFENTELLHAIEVRLKKSELLKKDFNRSGESLDDFFKGTLKDASLKELSENREKRAFKKKDNLYMEGYQPRGVFFITRGKVKTCKSNDDGKEYVTGLYKEGDFIGYTALLENADYQDTATAMEESETVFIPKDEFFSLLYSNRDVAVKFIRMLSDNVTELEERLLRLAYNSVRKRVSDALLTLQRRYAGEGENLNMPIPREDLASIAGTATETVIRTLSDFKAEGILEIRDGNIVILNQDKLARMRN